MLNHCDVYQYMTTVHKMETVHTDTPASAPSWYTFFENSPRVWRLKISRPVLFEGRWRRRHLKFKKMLRLDPVLVVFLILPGWIGDWSKKPSFAT